MTTHFKDEAARIHAIKKTRRFIILILALTMAGILICAWQIKSIR
jgi:hypothetical protein